MERGRLKEIIKNKALKLNLQESEIEKQMHLGHLRNIFLGDRKK